MKSKLKYIPGLLRAAFAPVQTHLPCRFEINYLDEIRKNRKFVFVTGMHRSGTTHLAKRIGDLQGVSGFSSAPGAMDEGQFLQRVLPIDVEFGGMGYFGYHPRSRMLEQGGIRARNIGICLLKDWLAYLDRSASVFVEKTPSNFRRCRLLASVFPDSLFIHIVRHPVATAMALQAFAPEAPGVRNRKIPSLVRHWTVCQKQALEDYRILKRKGNNVIYLALENLSSQIPELAAYLEEWAGIPVDPTTLANRMKSDVNRKYQSQYDSLPSSDKDIDASSISLMREFGYSSECLTAPPEALTWSRLLP